MGLSICPAAVVTAPVTHVWELLAEPTRYAAWMDIRTARIVPAGPAAPGQLIVGSTTGLGRTWPVTLRVVRVRPEQHQVQFHATLPLGVTNLATLTASPLDATTCRVQYG